MNEANVHNSKNNNKSGYTLKKKKQSNPFMKFIITVTGAVFVFACIVEIIATQAEIADKKHELQILMEQAEVLEDANDEYQSILSEEDERVFMERYAVEVLGYAYPNERRFYDTTGN